MRDICEITLESLLERHIATIVVYLVGLVLIVALLWISGILCYKLHNGKLKNGKLHLVATVLSIGAKQPQKGKKGMIQMLVILIVTTLILCAL